MDIKFASSVKRLFILLPVFFMAAACSSQQLPLREARNVRTGAELTGNYVPGLLGKTVAVVANPTSRVGNRHLVDTLLSLGVKIKCVFAPEHGFRGEAADGETIADGKDISSGLPVISLYGKHQKPLPADLDGIDIVLFDIQDVGARFYTYIATLQYVMEACADKGVAVIVLDRPNPNGFYVDGPVLDKKYRSFIGLNSIPVVYGMTIGEYAMMINGEHWLDSGKTCTLKVIRLRDYSHNDLYQLPIAPSPNLPNMTAIYLYPSLCFFEGTRVSVGRGTGVPFQIIGYPGFTGGDTTFKPVAIPGKSESPPYRDTLCNGLRLQEFGDDIIKNQRRIYLFWLMAFYESYPDKEKFFTSYFNRLAGNDSLQRQLREGMKEDAIRDSWKEDIDRFKKIRKKYLLYPDFE